MLVCTDAQSSVYSSLDFNYAYLPNTKHQGSGHGSFDSLVGDELHAQRTARSAIKSSVFQIIIFTGALSSGCFSSIY